MNERDYKLTKPDHLNGLTVRDVLIKEGNGSREIWKDVWANHVYKEILKKNPTVGLISDFRFPNEFDCFDRTYNKYTRKHQYEVKPKLIKILVNRPDGVFANDGADNELPDIDDKKYWDYTIINNSQAYDWRLDLKLQVVDIMIKEGII